MKLTREVELYAHEAEAHARGELRLLFRRYTPEGEGIDKGMEYDITYHYGDASYKLLKWRNYLPKVGGDTEGAMQPLSPEQLKDAGFTSKRAFTRWMSRAGVTTHVVVGTLEPIS